MKINLVLIWSIFLVLIVIFVVDSESLNSLVIDYSDNLVINEVIVSSDDEEEKTEKEETKENDNKAVMVNNDIDKWVFPVGGSYVITTYYSYSHKAIDIYSYAGYGSSVMAANSGYVVKVAGGCYRGDLICNGRGGNYVVIKHNSGNYYTVYMHLADIYVSEGAYVNSGSVIGSMGNTGYVIPAPTSSNPYGGTHLHFCVYIGHPDNGGYAINPFNMY